MSIVHYEGKLGVFDYDNSEWEICETCVVESLRYIGDKIDGKDIKIPEGVTDCSRMFKSCISLINAPEIPKGVTDCYAMFDNCISLVNAPEIPEGVTDCYAMFNNCISLVNAPEIPEGVTDCSWMFRFLKELQIVHGCSEVVYLL